MEPIHNAFPVFVSGQYLTSEHLNEMQAFLWQEEKNSRSFLAGNGIIAGMLPGFEDNTKLKKIKVSAGAASTVDGYLVITNPLFISEKINSASTIDEWALKATDVVFDKAVETNLTSILTNDGSRQLMEKKAFDKLEDQSFLSEKKDLNVFELFAEAKKIEDLPEGSKTLEEFNMTPAQASANYALMAWVYVDEAENDHCQQGDCNTKGIQRNYIVRYFLVENNQLTPLNNVSPEIPLCIAARIKNLSQSGSTAGVFQKSFAAWSSNITELQPYFSAANSGKQLGIIASLLGTEEQTSLANAITNFTQIANSVTEKNCPQYYIAFASDLSKAINELVSFYNDYAEKYPTLSRDRIERVVVMGSLSSPAVDSWRYYFIPMVTQVQHVADKRKLRKLFLRVTALANNFIIEANIFKQAGKVNAVLATPTLIGDGLLQDRAIPYYYDVLQAGTSNDVLRNWNPQGGNLQNIFCYYDSVISGRNNNPNMAAKASIADWTNENFFRIEGHIGLTKAAAISAINALIINDDLPIQLLDCDVDYKGPKKWFNWYTEFTDLVAVSLDKLRKEPDTKHYAYDPLKKISTYAKETSYRQPDEIRGILNDFTAYSGVFYNAKILATPKKKAKKGVALAAETEMKSRITPKVIETYKKIIPQEKITDILNKYNDAVTEVADPKAKKLIVLKDLAGLEYLGGAPRGGTLVLLHSNGNIIGDGCLSYFYRVDQGRIFNQ